MPGFPGVLRERILIGDGAMGTYLYELGVPPAQCLEELNVQQPELVLRVHREYAAAGAGILRTNSMGASRTRLKRFGLEDKTAEFNRHAVRLARQAAREKGGEAPSVAGSVGPLSLRLSDPSLDDAAREAAFEEQLSALTEEGCDLFFLETFTDLAELLLALRISKKLAPQLPVVASLAVHEEGKLSSGQGVAEAWRQLRGAGAAVCGINGASGVQACHYLLSNAAPGLDELVSVFPNAGKPEFYEGRLTYSASPDYFAQNLPGLVAKGAQLVGGDYGTRPEHVAALAAAAANLRPQAGRVGSKPAPRLIAVSEAAASEKDEVPQEESLLDRLKRKPVLVVELDSPKTLSLEKFLAGAQALKEGGADAVTLADNSLAILRMSNAAAAIHLRDRVGITPLIHVACRDRNLLGLQSDLMGLGSLGFRHVLALTGDPAKAGDHPGATSVYDVNSVGLIRLLAGMNRGVNAVGRDLKGRTHFLIGCAFNPNALHFDSQLKKLESKIAAGAQYVLTQPIFDVALARRTAEQLKPLGIPVFLGVMPLLHARNAEFLHNEVPGIKIPQEVRDRLRAAGDGKGAEIGVALAREIREVALEHFRAAYIITPMLRYELSLSLMG